MNQPDLNPNRDRGRGEEGRGGHSQLLFPSSAAEFAREKTIRWLQIYTVPPLSHQGVMTSGLAVRISGIKCSTILKHETETVD